MQTSKRWSKNLQKARNGVNYERLVHNPTTLTKRKIMARHDKTSYGKKQIREWERKVLMLEIVNEPESRHEIVIETSPPPNGMVKRFPPKKD